MGVIVSLYSSKKGEINNFLSKFYEKNLNINDSLKWEQTFANIFTTWEYRRLWDTAAAANRKENTEKG